MTIHAWDLNYVSREWLYTALTRCVDFNKVRFDRNKGFDKEMEAHMYRRYFENKSQDREKGRKIDEDDYVHVQWCIGRMNGNCQKCNTWLILKSKMVGNSDFTAQRLDNGLCHSKTICIHFCRDCNCSSR